MWTKLILSLFLWNENASSFSITSSLKTKWKNDSLTESRNNWNTIHGDDSKSVWGKQKKSFSYLQSSLSINEEKMIDEECDVLVLGSGPASRAIASLISSDKYKISTILADANYDRPWAPNYGVWEDEWEAITNAYGEKGISKKELDTSCIDTRWSKTDCYFGGSFDIPVKERLRVDRPYLRIDKDALRDTLSPNGSGANYKVLKANHISTATGMNMYSPSGSINHDENGSTIQLETKEGDITTVRAKLIVDATGHETSLIMRDSRSKKKAAGYQIAYGMLVEVDESDVSDLSLVGPYDKEAMTLFDYRTDHIPDDELMGAESAPTFMYAMPLGKNRIFFEETSLVARPALSFQTCKTRCLQRLKHLGITVQKLEEEEFCYIPMGGSLPSTDQRIIAFGGANTMVHPSTGYNLCRNMMGAVKVAETLAKELSDPNFNPNKAAAQAYDAVWSPSNIRQRNFAVFGGEFLMKQNVRGLRGFFDGFFRLPMETWGGFLAGWPGLPNNERHETWTARLWFGLLFVSKLPIEVSLDMFVSIITTSLWDGGALIQSVTPLLGEPEGYAWETRPKTKEVGDVAAKLEAREMIQASKVTEALPIAFGEMDVTEELSNVKEEDQEETVAESKAEEEKEETVVETKAEEVVETKAEEKEDEKEIEIKDDKVETKEKA